jgi:hypothetical protein
MTTSLQKVACVSKQCVGDLDRAWMLLFLPFWFPQLFWIALRFLHLQHCLVDWTQRLCDVFLYPCLKQTLWLQPLRQSMTIPSKVFDAMKGDEHHEPNECEWENTAAYPVF